MTEPPLISEPGEPSLPVSYRQGVILTWSTATLENTVRVGGPGGPVFENLPVLGVAETATYQPGDVVGLINLGWTLAIIGQLVIPGSPQALDALSFLSSRVYADNKFGAGQTTSTTFTDLDDGPGPSLSAPVPPSGRVLVTIGGFVSAPDEIAYMAVELSGANVAPPGETQSFIHGGLSTGIVFNAMASFRYLAEGLSPGLTTFTCRYRTEFGNNTVWNDRTLIVEAL